MNVIQKWLKFRNPDIFSDFCSTIGSSYTDLIYCITNIKFNLMLLMKKTIETHFISRNFISTFFCEKKSPQGNIILFVTRMFDAKHKFCIK